MTAREKLQLSYELAFFPPRLNALWTQIRDNRPLDLAEVGPLLDTALLLHQALPESGYASQRALNRLALYQARARAFGMVRFLRHIRATVGLAPLTDTRMPGSLVRDIGLPALCRQRPGKRAES